MHVGSRCCYRKFSRRWYPINRQKLLFRTKQPLLPILDFLPLPTLNTVTRAAFLFPLSRETIDVDGVSDSFFEDAISHHNFDPEDNHDNLEEVIQEPSNNVEIKHWEGMRFATVEEAQKFYWHFASKSAFIPKKKDHQLGDNRWYKGSYCSIISLQQRWLSSITG
ncbi:hypothetical protein PIB30_061495 [Stylosanthes scabra]|uniref:Uncharacterized protein n=1 Tax=Stylosanthes scabra TaxID=79078 RepID=A0ABU6RKS7_9FABA|nr:hypothetical protein [Stylosanthes scabra]